MQINKFSWGLLMMVLISFSSCSDYLDYNSQENTTEFTDGTDGWKIEGDAALLDPVYSETSGLNNSGYIYAKDNVTGGVWYFVAPSKYLGDKSAFSGGSLRFYLLQESAFASQFVTDDIIILGADGTKLVHRFSSFPEANWTKYEIKLNTLGEWRDESGALASNTKIEQVLSDVAKLSIRGEYESGPDTGGLDSFSFRK